MKPGIIYGLTDPRDGRVMYIGKTTVSLSKRLSCHITKARQSPRVTPVQKWVYDLLMLDLLPTIVVIGKMENQSDESEADTIERYRKQNADLLNVVTGTKPFYRKAAELFQKARRARNWTPTEAAYHLKTCSAMIYAIENGKVIPNGLKLALRIERAFGIPAIAWDDPETPAGGEVAK